ncbi:hypothetical protein F7725_019804 [Dissostichus mawsoni]|uniref:Vesicular inhibitory amino acid transporter n=1 Tax=Dissostichus mawsoni TaxID=36200 RepID=A0A7J5YKV4_DISMA|nr:hypothetical protein F7725_019804 [Dissostichus mawsoni]
MDLNLIHTKCSQQAEHIDLATGVASLGLISLLREMSSSRVSDSGLMHDGKTSRGREADSAHSEAEDGLSSLGSQLWAALELCWVSVGPGSVEAAPALDIKEDEEMLILTHSDELSRTYGEDNRLPLENITNRNNSSEDTRRNSTFVQESPTLKETRATVISTGPRTITITSAVSTSDSFWFKNSNIYGKEKRSSETDNTEENKTQSYRMFRGNTQKPRLSERGEEGEETVEGTSQFGTNLEEEIAKMSLGNPGIFVLGLPFALVRSGYVGLVLLVLSAWVCNHTGRILVACLYEEEQSYQDVVEACCKGLWPHWPALAGWMVNVAQVIELLMTCTLYLVVSSSLLSDSVSGMAVPRSVCSLLSLVFLLPCLLLTDLRPVSTLSLLCSLAHILISLLVMLYCLSRASSWSWSTLSLSVDPEDFLVSVGVIIFSYTSQIFLPPLEGSMVDRGQFNTMLGWTHGAACIMKTLFSLLAVLTWGEETSEVITDNLPLTSDLSSTCACWLKPCCPTLCPSTLLLKYCKPACLEMSHRTPNMEVEVCLVRPCWSVSPC